MKRNADLNESSVETGPRGLPPLPPLPRRRRNKESTDATGMVTFSARFTEEQRALISRAAELKGWTPTSLLRRAALERAAHIVNTATQTRLDLRRLAYRVADSLFAARTAKTFALHDPIVIVDATVVDELHPEQAGEPEAVVQISPREMTPEQLDQLVQAARYGGAEFINMIVEACQSVIATKQPGVLPDPVDPPIS